MDNTGFVKVNGKDVPYYMKPPKGFYYDKYGMTAPFGYAWYTNGKSFIKGERKNVLVVQEYLPLRK